MKIGLSFKCIYDNLDLHTLRAKDLINAKKELKKLL